MPISASGWPARPTSAAPSASTASRTATSNSPSGRCRATSRSTACASWSIAPTAPPTRSRPRRCGSSAPRSSRSASTRRLQHQPRGRLDRPPRLPPRCARCAPISASRSTATPTGCVVTDEKGQLVDGDQLMAAIAESWAEDGRLAKPGHRRHGHVQSRPRALPRRHRPRPRAHAGRRPLRRRGHARRRATISAASSPATSSSPTTPPPATAWSRRCSFSPSSRNRAGRSARSATASSRCRRS